MPLLLAFDYFCQAVSQEAHRFITKIIKKSAPKRLTLLLCLIHSAQVQTRDYLVEMFLKQMKKIHNKAKEELEIIRSAKRVVFCTVATQTPLISATTASCHGQ